jgi:small conductance mechanosensitive channel
MDLVTNLATILRNHLPLALTAAVTALALALTHALLRRRERGQAGSGAIFRHVAMLLVTGLGVVALVLVFPMKDVLRGQLLSLLGIAFTAVVAFSSTSFVANAMAGLMLRAVGNFRTGDWISVGDQFGRITERGLFHTEIQTEDRDLATLPNLYLATNPMKVVRASGTIVSAEVSLGYDVDHRQVESLLARAAQASELEDPFVHIVQLGDFSVTYRSAGFLVEVKHLLSARSRLRECILDELHGAGIEIVSPNYMNQRQLAEGRRVLPPPRPAAAPEKTGEEAEQIIFDKADEKALEEETEQAEPAPEGS